MKTKKQKLAEKHVTMTDSVIAYEKKPIEQIMVEATDINTSMVAEEVLVWVALNVENFIDNTQKTFKLDLILDAEGETCSMPETKKLQDLYRSIPEDEEMLSVNDMKKLKNRSARTKLSSKALRETMACREKLNEVTQEAFKKMKVNKEILDQLYKRMIFYYEMKAIHNGKPVIQELKGGVDVLKFEYETFPVGVKIRAPDLQNVKDLSDIEEMRANMSTIKEYVIPEGFTIWIELAFTPTFKQTSLF